MEILFATYFKLKFLSSKVILSGWPSGLRRQTQGTCLTPMIRSCRENSGPRMRAWVQIPLLTAIFHKFLNRRSILSGWPSGLRRQTQGTLPCSHDRELYRDFWSSYEGVGSNPTSDSKFFYLSLSLISVSRICQGLLNK